MATETPTQDQVIDGAISVLEAMSPAVGVVVHHESNLDDELEFVKQYKIAGEDMHLFLVDTDPANELEGKATGEVYCFYNLRIRYLSVMIHDESWSRDALARAELARRALSGHASVFAIGGQRQLVGPETVEIVSKQFATIGDQRMYEIVIGARVEARRWS